MTIEANSPAIFDLVAEDAEVEQLATGFTFTEGPIWNKEGQHLDFSDMPANIRRRWTAEGGIVELRNPSNKCNGMTFDAEGNLYVCEHETSSLIREAPDGTRTTVASHYNGKELNSPNDVVVKSDGAVYFSDPTYGRMPVFGLEREQDLGLVAGHREAAGAAGRVDHLANELHIGRRDDGGRPVGARRRPSRPAQGAHRLHEGG